MAGFVQDPQCGDMKLLGTELETRPGRNGVSRNEDIPSTLSELCSRPKHHTVVGGVIVNDVAVVVWWWW